MLVRQFPFFSAYNTTPEQVSKLLSHQAVKLGKVFMFDKGRKHNRQWQVKGIEVILLNNNIPNT
jgi:hypothetical protein